MLSRRQLAALLALVGLFIATYLTLHNLGIIGTLTCTVGSCETVQTSKWARFLGLPVAMWGAGFYLSMLVLALLGESASYAEARWVPGLMLAFSGIGVLFSAWLTWLELYVIHAICMYCVASAVITVLLFAVSLLDWRATQAPSA